MRRRDFIKAVAGSASAWPFAAGAQQSARVPRIGYLSAAEATPRDGAFWQRLQELGYVDGKNIVVENRFAEGKFDRLRALAEELVRLEVDVIVTSVTQASLAAKYATRTIPIVFAAVSDPLGTGLVASLARPGGNITGTAAMSADVVGKSLELLREAVPAVSRIAVIWNPDNAVYQAQMLRDTQLAAGRLEIELSIVAVRGPHEFDAAFATIAGTQAGALMVLADPIYSPHAARMADLANKNRLPAMYSVREYAVAGGLMAYGASFTALFRRAADYVDRILKGAKPADLPVEQPTKFDFVINLKAARELGLTMPPTLLAGADEIIE
jgi:putative ABC transport system substrate-binding protein